MAKLDLPKLTSAAQAIRLLSIDAIAAAKSGHLGLPLGCAELAIVLWAYHLRAGDQFVLSAGHGSMLLYSLLHLAGNLTLEDIKNFRQQGSLTPGHPEFGHTPAVACTTGPLGQGIANAVGMALAKKMKAEDGFIYVLAGDGCLQEGISYEACALAGHWKLNNLVLLYDQNGITLDAPASRTQSESLQRFEAAGWEVASVDGHDFVALDKAFESLKSSSSGKPKILAVKTIVGKGIAEVEGKNAAHGEAGVKYAPAALAKLGWEGRKAFEVKPEAYNFIPKRTAATTKAQPYTHLAEALATLAPLAAEAIATRVAGGLALTLAAKMDSRIVSGSADLFSSTKNYLEGLGDFSPENPKGRNLHFGIREHAMAAICNGLAYDGNFRAACATFMVFSDYMRPAIRIAALSGLNTLFYLTHDSVFVGEDGPTHQPVEQLNSLRMIPNLHVWRPADAEETLGAVAGALARTEGPSALILSRQNLPLLGEIPLQTRRHGAMDGAYIAHKETGPLKKILIASGSELHPAIAIAKKDPSLRVVSLVCLEAFRKLPEAKQNEILPPSCPQRVVMEAATQLPFAGIASRFAGVEGFGQSAPASKIADSYQLTTDKLSARI